MLILECVTAEEIRENPGVMNISCTLVELILLCLATSTKAEAQEGATAIVLIPQMKLTFTGENFHKRQKQIIGPASLKDIRMLIATEH